MIYCCESSCAQQVGQGPRAHTIRLRKAEKFGVAKFGKEAERPYYHLQLPDQRVNEHESSECAQRQDESQWERISK